MLHTSEVDYDDVSLQAVLVPFPCALLTLREKVGGVGTQYDIAAPTAANTKYRHEAGEPVRFPAPPGRLWQLNEIAGYIQVASGGGTITFSRECV